MFLHQIGFASGCWSDVDEPADITFYIVFAPEDVGLEKLVQVPTIESGFEALKQEAGLDEYGRAPGQAGTGTSRCLLAHAFLVRNQEAALPKKFC